LNSTERDDMANTSSAKKMVRKIERRTEVNKARRSRVRTYLRKVEEAIAARDKKAAAEAFRAAQPELHRAVTRGVVAKLTASRKLSRLSARIKSITA
jgi:small subunit ribosomal protein S20